ncbi:OadG family transporter subunit [Aliiglaciecola sp. CAU 1673]|uniref:OadG family transporter subunit n=1 Tax=Aliiglaciecola sp. CAU 1673 TaxID=3032595 RepID=UPI0023DA5BB6|nr:OadG family transporter subunit [Aliiglaciecola sp. CAU 1673]MDF2178252.1 OadG family transporter subunit [Aliiglaciecola sp. CAU 1673]
MTTSVQSLLFDAAMLLVVGMLVVFLFLSLLIGAIQLVSRFCKHTIDEPISVPANLSAKVDNPGAAPSASVIAAISAAIHQHRQQK